ncbi:MAG: PD40 domain-containing protein [Thermoplasmata archaeon]|nr:PD40 domain-containing protein [Thermoplasmata archaeon]
MGKPGTGTRKYIRKKFLAISLAFFMLSIGAFPFLDQESNQSQIVPPNTGSLSGTRAPQTLETEHFTITFQEGMEMFATEAINIAEEIYPDAIQLANYTPDEKISIDIKGFQKFRCLANTGDYDGIHIVFQSEWSIDWASNWGNRGNLEPIIAHELHHVLLCQKFDVVNMLYSTLPWWYYDGLADYFSSGYSDDKLRNAYSMHTKYYLEEDELMMLDEMLDWGGYSGIQGYVEGFSVFTYIEETFGQQTMTSFIENSEKNQSVHDGFMGTFGQTQDQFQTEWLDWLHNNFTKDVVTDYTTFGEPLTNTTEAGLKIPTSWRDGRILYTSDIHGTMEIFSMNDNGTDIQRLTNNYYTIDTDAKYSHDASKIMFTSDRGMNFGVYIMDADGNNVTILVDDQYLNFAGSWSPGGDEVTFISNRAGNYDIYSMNTDGTGISQLTTDAGSDGNPVFSPSGEKLLFVSDRAGTFQLFIMDSDGSNVEQLTFFTGDVTTVNSISWSPDGKKVMFEVLGQYYSRSIHEMSLDDLEPVELIGPLSNTTYTNVRFPVWSEDAEEIVFTSAGEIYTYEVFESPSTSTDSILIFIGILLTTVIGALLVGVIRKYS